MDEKCEIDQVGDNANNGMITKIWGESAWIFLHTVTFGYPLKPTEEQKKAYKEFFIRIGDVLPCRYCRDSYKQFINEDPTKLTDEVMESRHTLTKWLYDIHNRVNHKLGMDYGVRYGDIVKRYESFRAKCIKEKPVGCIVPLDYKTFSYKNLYNKDCPIVSLECAQKFSLLAKKRGIPSEYMTFLDLVGKTRDLDKLKDLDVWKARNKFCQTQIKRMRESGIPALETTEEYKGLPTIDELKLLMFLSTTLSSDELDEALKLLKN
jgi:hypothetical protein